MEIVLSVGAIESLHKNLEFLIIRQGVPYLKAIEIQESIFERIRSITLNTEIGQREELIASTRHHYRRLVQGNYKIIYYTEGETIYITDIFDSRQHPAKMKS